MKSILSFLLSILICQFIQAQSVGIGTNTPNANAALEIKSNNKGILMPRVNTAVRMGMTNVAKGMMVYDTTASCFYYHDGGKWRLFNERNTDSLTTDFINNPEVTANMANYSTTTARSGILYDNGGPAGNYANGASNTYVVNIDANDSVVGYKVIVEQMNMEVNDSFAIFTGDDPAHALFINGTTTGTYYFNAANYLYFSFLSNATINAPGFKIRWSIIVGKETDPAPSSGWYYNPKKIAVRGGLSSPGSWEADSLGRISFAFGSNAKARGNYSIAMGFNSSAAGLASFAVGPGVVASGKYSTAMGTQSIANADYAVAIGADVTASNNSSVAMGAGTVSSGKSSFATGSGCIASGNYSSAFGKDNKSTGAYSASFGLTTTASGDNSFAIGDSTLASGFGSLSVGDRTKASLNNSVAMGTSTWANGDNAIAAGEHTTSRSLDCFVMGRYNQLLGSSSVFWIPTDPLFIIGNGTSSTPHDAVTVLKNGNVGVGTNVPNVKLHIDGGVDANLTDGTGYLVIGDVAGTNLVFDNNEIIARNNGANNTLTLQNNGGAFEIGGTAAKPGGGSWAATSDARLKENVKPYSDGLQTLLKIKPVYYNYNKLSGYDQSKQYIGVLAQELKEVAPYMVGTFKKDSTEYYNVDNTSMTYMLINAVREQQEQIKTQQLQIDELKTALAALLKKNN